ncbi:MAG: Putative serine protease [uncultured Nocardioidaceae bacterium]|uniref:Serine protease n=1 Tax=uncultured Nocardioidaceae bacterium TaxID=253824 RepID=A0A6J4M0R2_9ACTN|nr:MAG: Putative serine protease [uncultured Nocardioidaceae bacterium]
MNHWLDVLLLVLVLGYGLSGYWQGFLVGASATLGLLLGGAVGALALPRLLQGYEPSLGLSVIALGIVLLCALVGQAIGSYLGGLWRRRVTWRPARSLDALAGAALSMAAALLVAWVLGYAVSGTRIPAVSTAVRSSVVLEQVDQVLPESADQALGTLTSVVDNSLFPRYLEPFTRERIEAVPQPDSRIANRAGVRDASGGVVKVLGEAPQCGSNLQGSGFVYAPERVMTNAHVVAGVDALSVTVDDDVYEASVVLYDPDLDVAVLRVDGLPVTPLSFDEGADSGDSAAVLGFPENGAYDVRPARLRSQQRLSSPDIYGDGQVSREVFAVRALIRQGNSGGPLVSPQGRVYGVVFAASLADDRTGYVLTARQVARDAAAGQGAEQPVPTGDCA